jgi:hypothetical protein
MVHTAYAVMLCVAALLLAAGIVSTGTASAATAAEDQYAETIPGGGGSDTPTSFVESVGAPGDTVSPDDVKDFARRNASDKSASKDTAAIPTAPVVGTGSDGPGTANFWETASKSPTGAAVLVMLLFAGLGTMSSISRRRRASLSIDRADQG